MKLTRLGKFVKVIAIAGFFYAAFGIVGNNDYNVAIKNYDAGQPVALWLMLLITSLVVWFITQLERK